MNDTKAQSWFYLILIAAAVLLLAAYHVFHWEVRICFTLGLLAALGLHGYKTYVIGRRNFDSILSLMYGASALEYFLIGVWICSGVYQFGFADPKHGYTFFLTLSMTGAFGEILMRMWIRSPRFILQEDMLIENDFHLRKRKLEDLHSIEFDWSSQFVRIRFVDQYDIRIYKRHYTKRQLADFIQKVIDKAPVEGDVEQDVLDFIKEHADS